MRIDEIVAFGYGAQQVRRVQKKDSEGSTENKKEERKAIVRRDSYTPSQSAVKAKDLDEVRQRIKDKFYDSDTVSEDLTELISSAFEKTI